MENHLKQIFEAALRSPSGDNCQPFRFKVIDSNTIQIFHVYAVAKHFFNSNQFASLIALGSVIETIFIEARGLGYIPTVDLTADLGSHLDQMSWATIKLTKTSMPLTESLIGAFETRWTNRAKFRNDLLPLNVIENCKKQASLGSTEIELFYEKPSNKEFIRYLQLTEFVIWAHQAAANDLLKMLRFPGRKENDKPVDGIASHELGITSIETLIMRLLHNYPSLLRVLFFFGFKPIACHVTKKNYSKSGGIIAFSTKSNTNLKKVAVETGRAAMRVWLYLNQQGYVLQPLTGGSMLCFQHHNNYLTSPINSNYKNIFSKGQSIWRKFFNIPETNQVVWSLRVGLPLLNGQRHRSVRMKLEDIFI